jgi:integrase
LNKKNRRTFGYIRRLPSKLYQASYVGQDGHRYYSPMPFVAKADAEGFLASEWTALIQGKWVSPKARIAETTTSGPTLTLRMIYPDFRDTRTTRTGAPLRRLTLDLYDRHMYRTMKDWLDISLDEITQEGFTKWYMALQAEGKKTTASKCYTLMRSVLNWAVEKQLLEKNPVLIKGGYASSTGRESEILTEVQVREVIDAIEPELKLAIQLMAYASLRFSEMSALQRKDIVIINGPEGEELLVNVDKAATKVTKPGQAFAGSKYEVVIGPPKSKMSKRLIAVHAGLIPFVKAHLEKYVADSAKSLVFGAGPNRDEYMRYEYLEHRYTKAKKRAGYGEVVAPIHSLRKFGATEFANSGANLTEISEWLGDGSIEAIKRYIKSNGRARHLANKMRFKE